MITIQVHFIGHVVPRGVKVPKTGLGERNPERGLNNEKQKLSESETSSESDGMSPMEWALANRSNCPRFRVSTVLAVFEKFVNIDI